MKTLPISFSEEANSIVNMSDMYSTRANIVNMHEIKFSYGCNSYFKVKFEQILQFQDGRGSVNTEI